MLACLVVPSLALASEIARHPGLRGRPVALVDEAGVRVADVTEEAGARGVRPGMTLREAEAYCPALDVLEPHPARTARAHDALLAALETVSPLVEDAGEGIAFAGLGGLEGLYPRPGMLERAILAAAPAALRPRLGLAGARFTGLVAARLAAPLEARRIEAADAQAVLAEQPAGWLPLDDEARERLRLLGIHTMGAFASLPHHAVQAQFGVPGGLAWLAARGEDPTPLRPRPPARERVLERAQAEPPLVSREAVLQTAEQLLGRALHRPRARRRFVRTVRLRATTEQDRLWERTQVMKEPTGERGRLWTAIRPLLEHAEYPGPVAALELEIGGLTEESGRQGGLFVDHAKRREQLDEMVRHLKVRYGHSPVARVVEVEPWHRLPERRYALMDYDP